MFKKVVHAFVLIIIPVFSYAQGSAEKAALKFWAKHQPAKAYAAAVKAVNKDSLSIVGHYVLAQYYLVPQAPHFQIDSSLAHISKARFNWTRSSGRIKEKLRKLPMDSLLLQRQFDQVDSAYFQMTRSANTVDGYEKYITLFPASSYRTQAEENMQEVAFQNALKRNTYDAFESYLKKYKNSRHQQEAQARFDKLLYEVKTSDQTLESYLAFLRDNPATPFRKDAEKNIFQLATASGSADAYLHFANSYRDNSYKKHALDFLYHILLEEHHEDQFPATMASDSLQQVIRHQQQILVPFLRNGKFGFMNNSGEEIIPPQEEDLPDDYLCGNIQEDVIVLENELKASNGITLWKGSLSSIDDLGYGLLKLEKDKRVMVIHKSGHAVTDFNLDDAKIISGRLLALKQNEKWGIFTLTGRQIFNYDFDDITSINNVVSFVKKQKQSLATINALTDVKRKPVLWNALDDVKKLTDGFLLVTRGDQQGVLDQQLRAHVPMARQSVVSGSFGFVTKGEKGAYVYDKTGNSSEPFIKAEALDPWVSVKTTAGWSLFDAKTFQRHASTYDTIQFHGPFAVALQRDSLIMITLRGSKTRFVKNLKIELIPGSDSTAFLQVEQGDKKTIYDRLANKLFTLTADKIQYAGANLFIVHKKEKKGLVDRQGNVLLPVEYDAIGTEVNETISLLKAMKFGVYHVRSKRLIKPEYEKNVLRYSDKLFTVFKNGALGFIDASGKLISKIEFAEAVHWTDSIALVKKDALWSLYNVWTGKTLLHNIKDYKVISGQADEKLMIIHQGNLAGVVSNRRGIVIPVKFSDIVNVGAPDDPVYLTETHVEEASIYVVIYYNAAGKLIKKDVYNQSDYEKIYCN